MTAGYLRARHRARSLVVRAVASSAGRRLVEVSSRAYWRAKGVGPGITRVDGGLWLNATPAGVVATRVPSVASAETWRRLVSEEFCWASPDLRGRVVIAVGAGPGGEVLEFADRVGPGGLVLAVEAHPEAFRALEAVVLHNNLDGRVIPVHAAVTSDGKEAHISDGAELHLNRTVGAVDRSTSIVVPGITLDHLWSTVLEERRVGLLKANIEGAEIDLLAGGRLALAATDDVVISCHDFLADEGFGDEMRTLSPVRQMLESLGFTVSRREDDPRPYIRDTLYGRRKVSS